MLYIFVYNTFFLICRGLLDYNSTDVFDRLKTFYYSFFGYAIFKNFMYVVFFMGMVGKIWVLIKARFPSMAILSILMALTYKTAHGIMVLNLVKLIKNIRKRRTLVITK